jgi:hypothetical protein
MKSKIALFITTIIIAACMIIYGGVYRSYKVYEMSGDARNETPFYDWFKETEIIVGTTFSGIQRIGDDRIIALSSYRSMMHQKLWKFCPS